MMGVCYPYNILWETIITLNKVKAARVHLVEVALLPRIKLGLFI